MRKALIVLVVAVSACISTASTQEATVTDVVDGDTVDVRYSSGETETVRLLGVDTPEVRGEVSPEEFEGVPDTAEGRECLKEWGQKASDYTGRVDGQNVTLKQDPVQNLRGDYGRLLAYIHFNDSNDSFNHELVEEGYARVYDSRFEEKQRFLDAETRARNENKSLWRCRDVG